MDTGEEFAGVVRLDHVVVGAEVEAVDPRADVGARGHHDHGGGGALADLPAHLVAVLVGQAEVEEHDAERLRVRGQQGLQGLLAAARVHDPEAVPGEDGGERGRDMVVVLDEQQSHGLPSGSPVVSIVRCRTRRQMSVRSPVRFRSLPRTQTFHVMAYQGIHSDERQVSQGPPAASGHLLSTRYATCVTPRTAFTRSVRLPPDRYPQFPLRCNDAGSTASLGSFPTEEDGA